MKTFLLLLLALITPTLCANDKYTDDSIIPHGILFKRPGFELDSHGLRKINNKNLNFTSQKIETSYDSKGRKTVTVTTGGFNKQDNMVHLDKKGIVPFIGHIELPGGVISAVKISNDGKRAYAISRWDDFYIVDISDIKKPKTLSKLKHVNISDDFLLSKDEKRLYLNTGNLLIIYDISDPETPKVIKSISSKNYYKGMALSPDEHALYIIKSDKSSIAKLDISKESIKEVDSRHLGGILVSLKQADDTLYVGQSGAYSVIDLNTFSVVGKGTVLQGRMAIHEDYILFASVDRMFLLKEMKQLNYFACESAWHTFYNYIRSADFTPNGKYIVMRVKNDYISVKSFQTLLPKFMVDEDSLYDQNDYFGNYYTAVLQIPTDITKGLCMTKDGEKLYVYDRSGIFIYDISKLK